MTKSMTRRTIGTARSAGARLHRRWSSVRRRAEAGMSTAEYAVGTLAACTFATVLIAIVRSDAVRSALSKVITSALAIAS
jgi:hypothetical protein